MRRAEAAGEGAGAARFRRLTMSDAVSSAPAWARIRHSSSLPSAAASWSGVRPCCGEGRWGEVSASGQWVWLRGGLTRCAPLSVARRRSASLGSPRLLPPGWLPCRGATSRTAACLPSLPRGRVSVSAAGRRGSSHRVGAVSRGESSTGRPSLGGEHRPSLPPFARRLPLTLSAAIGSALWARRTSTVSGEPAAAARCRGAMPSCGAVKTGVARRNRGQGSGGVAVVGAARRPRSLVFAACRADDGLRVVLPAWGSASGLRPARRRQGARSQRCEAEDWRRQR